MHNRRLFAGIAIVSFALVVGGVILGRTLNLAACPLCILQRMIYLLLSLEAAVLVALSERAEQASRAGAALLAATAGLGAGIAGYQTWLQRFATDVSCTADMPWWEGFVNWAGAQWPLLFEATGLCSEAGWQLLGLSIAEWSLLCFGALAITALATLVGTQRGDRD